MLTQILSIVKASLCGTFLHISMTTHLINFWLPAHDFKQLKHTFPLLYPPFFLSLFSHSLAGSFLELSKLFFERVSHLLGQLDRSLLDLNVVLFGVEVCTRVNRSANSSKQEQLTATSTLFRNFFFFLIFLIFVLV